MNVSYEPSQPLSAPVILHLPANGLRLRFDGPDQRLRLIEVVDFSKTHLTHEGKDIVKIPEGTADAGPEQHIQGPLYRNVYGRLFGLSFPGEYIPPSVDSNTGMGTYILSYPGIAFSFPFQHSAWSPQADLITLLSSSAARPASSIAIFIGASWPEASQDLYTRPCPHPRSLALLGRGRDQQPGEIELAKIRGRGRVDFIRRTSPDFQIILGETTPQDLLAELGPPDQIKYGKSEINFDIHKTMPEDGNIDQRYYGSSPAAYDVVVDSEHSSAHTTADESDHADHERPKALGNANGPIECFYNYFGHGLDVYVSAPTSPSPDWPASNIKGHQTARGDLSKLVATKILLHGNVPGSFQFNRYRRSRWVVELEGSEPNAVMDSETAFRDLAKSLEQVWWDSAKGESPYRRCMPFTRGWDSPGSSCELIGGWEEQMGGRGLGSSRDGAPGDGKAVLFAYPGTVFEVLKNDTVACVIIY